MDAVRENGTLCWLPIRSPCSGACGLPYPSPIDRGFHYRMKVIRSRRPYWGCCRILGSQYYTMQKNSGSGQNGVVNFNKYCIGSPLPRSLLPSWHGKSYTHPGLEAPIICLTLLPSDHSKSNVKSSNLICAIPYIMRRYLESHPWAVCIEV